MRIRDATREDTEAIRAVHRASIEAFAPRSYSDEQTNAWARGCDAADYASTVEAADSALVVAERDDEVVGFGSLGLDRPDAYETTVGAVITAVYVSPDAAREGVGTRLLADLEHRARATGVERVGLRSSLNAVPFYVARGYRRAAERDHEFSASESTGVTGIVVEMTKRLDEPVNPADDL